MAAIACNMKTGLFASLILTRVGRLVKLRDGGVPSAMGMLKAKLIKPPALSVQAAPVFASKTRNIGANVSEPNPAPERMNPIAAPLWPSKYSGATANVGKYTSEVPTP
jgi:hypothetical protein